MNRPDKIDLVKKSLTLLVSVLQPKDQISICTYAGNVSVALEPTSLAHRERIVDAINRLGASGSTSMGSGIMLAYNYAMRTYIKGGINRVIVCSDGDANVGPRSYKDILKLIEEYKNEGITLTTLGFGSGNYKDTMMEQLANKGNGNYYYIDKLSEGKKIFVDQLGSTLQVIAYDTKIQVEFNSGRASKFRLIGYENRKIAHRDFRNDKVDAGEIGSGHSVTAIYEVELNDKTKGELAKLKRRGASIKEYSSLLQDLLVLRLRYKLAATAKSKELSFSFQNFYPSFEKSPHNLQFAALVAETAEALRKSPYTKTKLPFILEIARTVASSQEREQGFIIFLSKACKLR